MAEESSTQIVSETKIKEICCSDKSCCVPQSPITRALPKIGRNDPCLCGNGRKFKKCCGRNFNTWTSQA